MVLLFSNKERKFQGRCINGLCVSLNYIKQNRLKDTLWKRERPAQMALPPIVTSIPPGTTIKGEGFYVKLF